MRPGSGWSSKPMPFSAMGQAGSSLMRPPAPMSMPPGRSPDPLPLHGCHRGQGRRGGGELESITTEYNSPQFEFTLAPHEGVQAVDEAFLFRLLAREVALEQGIILRLHAQARSPTRAAAGCT